MVFVGTTARGLTQTYLPPGTHIDDPRLAKCPTASNSISGRTIDGAVRTAALVRHPRVWVMSTPIVGAGPSTADRPGLPLDYTETGREEFGGFELTRWEK